jgi:hypothetical protein
MGSYEASGVLRCRIPLAISMTKDAVPTHFAPKPAGGFHRLDVSALLLFVTVIAFSSSLPFESRNHPSRHPR